MSLPNVLTISRFFMAALMMALLLAGFPFSKLAALAVFILAGITDALDGRLARARNERTLFGALFDPLADKVLVLAALVTFVELQLPGLRGPIVPAWVVVLILSREFLVTGLRVLAGSRGQDISAGRWGKHKTIWQIIIISVVLLGLTIGEDLLPRWAPGWVPRFHEGFADVAYVLALFTAGITVLSGVIYFSQHRRLLAENM